MPRAELLPRELDLPADVRLPRVGAVDAVALEARAAELAKRSIKGPELWHDAIRPR